MSTHNSIWCATGEQPSIPSLDSDVEVEGDLAVVGGGITGLTTALLLQREGARAALLRIESHDA